MTALFPQLPAFTVSPLAMLGRLAQTGRRWLNGLGHGLWFGGLRLLAGLGSGAAQARRRRQDRAALEAMGPRELADLGLGRGEIAHWTEPVQPTSLERWR
jgi:uncharacterized protein YjiS (DUF1127 family)